MGVNVLVAGPAKDCGQKVHNLLHGIDRLLSSPEVFVFCDSDARYPRGWLRDLVAPLKDRKTAVSTGYRWYVANGLEPPTLLRSVWNASVVTMLGDHGRNFAWGGSMAIRRETFESIRVRDYWSGSISDDYGLTQAARAAKAGITFVPSCLIPSHGYCTWRDMLDFTTRQILITRIYDPRVWRTAFAAQSLYVLAFWGLFIVMWRDATALAMWLCLFTLSTSKAAIRLRAVASVLSDSALSKHRWSYILCAPFIAVLYLYNLVRSALTRRLTWRQIQYELISPNRVIVRHGLGEN
jgi:cellulose synthase/poly-beta-1,6-N-acetylglucosamine synthase-like glycosyltransferase